MLCDMEASRSSRLAAVAALLWTAVAAAADVNVQAYRIGNDPGATLQGVSGDGYHYLTIAPGSEGQVWKVDGKLRQTTSGGTPGSWALSGDGRILLSITDVPRPDGGAGQSLSINGRPSGAVYGKIEAVFASEHGTNAGFIAREPGKGCMVVSAAGAGPMLPGCPDSARIVFHDQGVMYLANWNGTVFVYRDLTPLVNGPYSDLGASSDLSRWGVYDKDRHVVVIGTQAIPSQFPATTIVLGDDGHYAFSSVYEDKVVADGIAYDSSPDNPNGLVLRPRSGTPYWSSVGSRTLRIAGHKSPYKASTAQIGFSPDGKHVGIPVARDGVVLDDKRLESPPPFDSSKVVFDGNSAFHFLAAQDGALYLVCGTTDGSSPKRTACAAKARTYAGFSADL